MTKTALSHLIYFLQDSMFVKMQTETYDPDLQTGNLLLTQTSENSVSVIINCHKQIYYIYCLVKHVI